jgi:hypothetical protein
MAIVKRITAGLVMLALLAFPFIVYFKAQALVDWWQLRDYSPPPAISQLAAADTMTDYSRHIFYVNHPDLEANVQQFQADCTVTEQAIVLGCYHSNQDGIFIYDVSDSRLAGVKEVTAAHEMLHAAYDRLSDHDKNYVNGLLEDYYNHDLKDQRIIDEINSYKQTEPKDVVNEMHSVFGSEAANLPAPLETYYAKYFTNRTAVTGFAQNYQNEFTARQAQIKADDAQLAQMNAQIKSEEAALTAQLGKINADRSKLDNERSSGQTAQYNADVPGFNAEVEAYNSGVGRLQSDIKAYNQLVAARNAIAQQLASLDKAIDTRLAPQAAQ